MGIKENDCIIFKKSSVREWLADFNKSILKSPAINVNNGRRFELIIFRIAVRLSLKIEISVPGGL